MGEFGALARGVEDRLAHADLALRDITGECHTLAEQVEHLRVDGVYLRANFGEIHVFPLAIGGCGVSLGVPKGALQVARPMVCNTSVIQLGAFGV